jgi:SEC-C motif domain protein
MPIFTLSSTPQIKQSIMKKQCPCGSAKLYDECCKIFHGGKPAPSALLLMKSRYSAYACSLPNYIMDTTHPNNPQFQQDRKKWSQKIMHFCMTTQFKKLDILEFIDGEETAFVTFVAHLKQNGQEVKLFERSLFEKVNNVWLYREGFIPDYSKS